MDSTARTSAEPADEDDHSAGLLPRPLTEAFPWVRSLPQEAAQQFLAEFAGTAGPAAQMIAEWKHTAEVYADPGLYGALTTDHGDEDFGAVSAPEAAHG